VRFELRFLFAIACCLPAAAARLDVSQLKPDEVKQGTAVVSEGPDRLHLHLVDGSEHETDPKDPDRYQVSTFEQTDIPIELPSAENKAEESQPAGEMDIQRRRSGEVRDILASLELIELAGESEPVLA